MALLLKEEHVRRLLTMEAALDAVASAFAEVARGDAVNLARHRAALHGATVNSMGAMSAAFDLAAVKVYPIVRQDISVGSSFQVLAWRLSTGALEAVIEAERLAQVRTGAATGVATRHMARPDSRVMVLIGAGWQAQAQLEAISLVLPALERVQVWSRSAQRVQDFIGKMAPRVAARLEPVVDLQAALAEADVVTTVTGAHRPLFDGRWLRAGTHVNAVGSNFASKQEIDPVTLSRAARVIADDVEVARTECGDLLLCPDFDWSRLQPLAEVVAGRSPGRVGAGEITVFESQGLGLEDLAMAHVLIGEARARGEGIEIPLV